MALVVNGRSGSSDVDLRAIAERMRDNGAEVRSVESTDDPQKIQSLVKRACEVADVVVIGGGDGTISGTLPVFLETRRTLGVLPLGTANDLARSLGIPLDPLLAADVLSSGSVRPIDLGEVDGRPFCNAISVGYSAKVAGSQEPVRKKWLGNLEYPISWIKAAREFRPVSVTLRHEGGETRFKKVSMLTVMNGRYHGRGMSVDDRARIDDGVLKVYCVQTRRMWELLPAFLSLQRGRVRDNDNITLFRARDVEIAGRRPMPLNVDGDVVARTPARVRVLPAAITTVVPAGR